MVRRKKAKGTSFRFVGSKGELGQKILQLLGMGNTLKVLAAVCIFAVIGIGFALLDKYVKKVVPVSEETAILELVNVPAWVSKPLKEKIYIAARTNNEDLKLDEDAALSVQQNIKSLVAWVEEVKVQTTHQKLLVRAKWRKPLALVKSGFGAFYVDAEMVILDFVPLPNLPIVTVRGLSGITKAPAAGEVWKPDDLAAAVDILARLERMDKLVTPKKPLLYEIESIDVSNFNGRESARAPHIVLYAKDKTEIIWGAQIGAWHRYLEATDEEKLAKLYSYYKERGTLLNGAKYINLRDPQNRVPQPIDKY